VVEGLLSKCAALSSNSSAAKNFFSGVRPEDVAQVTERQAPSSDSNTENKVPVVTG
jgi:hypothetical protein